jgi:hypothetical protein
MAASHPLTDDHPYARRKHLHPAPRPLLWNGHSAWDGDAVRARFIRPRPEWTGYPSGWCPPDVCSSLKQLGRTLWKDHGYQLRVNALGRDPELDAVLRKAAGGPYTGAHNPATWTPDLVGWHLGGRAIDVTLSGDPEERARELALILSVALPLGWTTIAGEDWHLEYHGPWAFLVAHLGSRQGALASLLDSGGFRDARWEWRAVQAQCWRLETDVGKLDQRPTLDPTPRAVRHEARGAAECLNWRR